MSFLSSPLIASTVARILQRASALNAGRMTRQARSRLPEYPRLTEVIEIPTALGAVKATVYRPGTSAALPPVFINLHGGGYVMNLTEMDDPLCRAIADQSGVVVVNVDYALAPQHPFPAPPEQVYEILKWVNANGNDHGWDGTKLVIGGQSAGGGLAAAATRLAFERGGPAIALQILHYPPLDLTVPVEAKDSPLAKPALRPWMGEVFDTSYAPDQSMRTNPLISPAGPADRIDLTGIAPAIIIAAENDILRDEARRYAERLEQVGALIEYREVAGADHGYDLNNDELARQSYTQIAEHIRQATQS